MSNIQDNNNLSEINRLMKSWIVRISQQDQIQWLDEKLQKIMSGDRQSLFLAFGQVTRKFPRSSLNLHTEDMQQAYNLRTGWQPQFWTLDQLVRSLMVLSFDHTSKQNYLEVIDKLFATGEVHELVALYQTLPLFPFSQSFIPRATEGIRTSMQVVFQAVAHHNPFPADYLDEMSFNQMVLKAIFVGVPLYKIMGLEQRANRNLSKMLTDYARERWAAKRVITPELWRCVGKYADDQGLECMHRALSQGTPLEVEAATLALIDAGQTVETDFKPTDWDTLGLKVEIENKS